MKSFLIFFVFFIVFAHCSDVHVGLITDIHLNLYYEANINIDYDCWKENGDDTPTTEDVWAYGRYGCDGTYYTMKSGLEQLKKNMPSDTEVIVVPGDLIGHPFVIHGSDYNQTIATMFYDILKNVTGELKEVFGDKVVLFSFGNNDVLYHSQVPKKKVKDEFYDTFYQYLILDMPKNMEKLGFSANKETFYDGGYYYYDYSDDIRFLVMNTLYYFDDNDKDNDPDVGPKQWTWLEDNLKSLEEQNKQAILVMHIPPYKIGHEKSDFKSDDKDTYLDIVKTYKETIISVIGAHVHIAQQFLEAEVTSTQNLKVAKSDPAPFSDYLTRNLLSTISYTKVKDDPIEYSLSGNMMMHRAITSRDQNDPGYSILTYQQDSDKYIMKKVQEYAFDLLASKDGTKEPSEYWSYLYDSSDDLEIDNFAAESLKNFHLLLTRNPELLLKYICYMSGFRYSRDNIIRAIEVFQGKNYLTDLENQIIDYYVNLMLLDASNQMKFSEKKF